MSNHTKNSSIADGVLYPHLKITSEDYPRLLATRRILNKTDVYFGAYLSSTNVRIWLYRLNKIFRLRSCEIEIDGNFPNPCQMYFAKRCLAPCVKEICGQAEYLETVQLLKLFLGGKDEEFTQTITRKIEYYAENLEFEKAAEWRDLLENAQTLKNNQKWQISLENAVDTFTFEEIENQIIVYLITTRGRKLVGNFEFIFENMISPDEIFSKIIREFYQFHAPREIRLPVKLPKNSDLTKFLREKFARSVKVSFHQNDLNLMAQFRLKRAKMESELSKISRRPAPSEILAAMQKIFTLPDKPQRIECFDVAHISNQNFVTASVTWENGKIRPELSAHFISDAANELEAMAGGINERLKSARLLPDLILIDGGQSQLNAAISQINKISSKNIPVISAVKPPGKHSGISHFLTADKVKIEFIEGDPTFEILRSLRDEAHRTANELYRQLHENRSIFAQNLPLVSIRFDEIGGETEDLIPIKSNLVKN